MGGAILNMITVAIGSIIGLLVGNRLSQKIQESVVTGIGLVTIFVGVSNAAKSGNIIIPLLSIAIGVIIGELLDIQTKLERFGGWLQSKLAKDQPTSPSDDETQNTGSLDSRTRFITGFVTASLVFCIGPLTFVGSIQDGMGLPVGFQQIAIKSILDLFTAMAFAASFGVGVSFSIVTILVIQGGLSLLGAVAGNVMTTAMINEMTGVGGIMLMGLALILLDIKKPRMANFLPALILAPLIVAVAGLLHINIYPL
ncbi:MAG: DUF554 family protein [Anaerolineaceae bacterium]|nr:DUF554 family protein [Anaerolineaceae bacterium]